MQHYEIQNPVNSWKNEGPFRSKYPQSTYHKEKIQSRTTTSSYGVSSTCLKISNQINYILQTHLGVVLNKSPLCNKFLQKLLTLGKILLVVLSTSSSEAHIYRDPLFFLFHFFVSKLHELWHSVTIICLFAEVKQQWAMLIRGWVTTSVHYARL